MSEYVVIALADGKIRGIKQTSQYSGAQYYSFFGIPYGQPPVNNLRFRDPIKVKPWKHTYDATSEKSGCSQFLLQGMIFCGTEDCLYNDIHLPKPPSKDEPLRPVIVNIHPGGHLFGRTRKDSYGSPEFIMHHDVVYICISFRLNIFGFLNLKLKECSGNQAAKDIILALQWIKHNIRSFGGDAENITLLGSSSGAMMINLLMLSPNTKGLFHKAILMGGYLQAPGLSHQESNEDHARKLAKLLGYGGDLQDNKKLLSFLKKQKPEALVALLRTCQKDRHAKIAPIFPMSVFAPSLDKGVVLPEWSETSHQSLPPIPLMIGFSKHEPIMGFTLGLKNHTEENFKESIRQNYFSWGHNLTDDDLELLFKEVFEFYANGKPLQNILTITKIEILNDLTVSDVYDAVIHPILVNSHSTAPVFVYKFEFEGNLCNSNTVMKNLLDEPVAGTFHGTDFSYWNKFGDPEDEKAREVIENFTKFITTFAKNGDPNFDSQPVKWKSHTFENPCYLSINDEFKMVQGKLSERLEFWDDIKRRFKKK